LAWLANATADVETAGEVPERLKGPVLKTGEPQGSMGSNPILSDIDVPVCAAAIVCRRRACRVMQRVQHLHLTKLSAGARGVIPTPRTRM
jgi:hypothetical protein